MLALVTAQLAGATGDIILISLARVVRRPTLVHSQPVKIGGKSKHLNRALCHSMGRLRLSCATHLLVLCCSLNLLLIWGEEAATSSEPSAEHHKHAHHAHAHLHEQPTLTTAVSLRDCRHEQLPDYMQPGAAAAAEPVDYLLTVAVSYRPGEMRALFNTFRRHNQAARLIVLVGPDQVRCLQACLSISLRVLKAQSVSAAS